MGGGGGGDTICCDLGKKGPEGRRHASGSLHFNSAITSKRETILPEGREGAIVNQTNIWTCFKGDAGEKSSAERRGGAHNSGLFRAHKLLMPS